MIARPSRRRLLAASLLAALVMLDGCATFGGNVKGSFSCQAPEGTCAPSSTFDDRALAMISGEAGDMAIPAGPYVPPATQPRRTTIAAVRTVLPSAGASRSSERVLRIVFQPFVDEAGRLHEASAVRTVVRGEWQAAAEPVAAHPADPTKTGDSLAEAVDRAEPPVVLAAADPDLPDPAVVAAARARRPDAVAAIKADVAARLAAPRHRGAAPRRPAALAVRTPMSAPVALPQPVSPSAPPKATPPAVTASMSAETAAARVRTDPRWTSAAAATSGAARTSAAAAGATAMRATSFPGVTNEEN